MKTTDIYKINRDLEKFCIDDLQYYAISQYVKNPIFDLTDEILDVTDEIFYLTEHIHDAMYDRCGILHILHHEPAR